MNAPCRTSHWALHLNPNYADAYYNRGATYADIGDYERALHDYDQALQIAPNDAESYIGRGVVYKRKGEYDRALQDSNQAITLNPNDADAYYLRGAIYAETVSTTAPGVISIRRWH